MKNHILARLFSSALLLMLSAGLSAHQLGASELATGKSVEAGPVDRHADLYASLREGLDDLAVTENLLDTIIAELMREVPEFALLEDASPGLTNSLRDSFRPILIDYSERVRLEFEPAMIDVIREELTPEEASQVAAFYRSPLGRKIIAGVGSAYTAEQSLRGAAGNPQHYVAQENIEKDIRSAGIRAYLGLTPEERQAADNAFGQTPALSKFVAMQPRINAVRFQMENAPLSAEEEERLDIALEAVFSTLFEGP